MKNNTLIVLLIIALWLGGLIIHANMNKIWESPFILFSYLKYLGFFGCYIIITMKTFFGREETDVKYYYIPFIIISIVSIIITFQLKRIYQIDKGENVLIIKHIAGSEHVITLELKSDGYFKLIENTILGPDIYYGEYSLNGTNIKLISGNHEESPFPYYCEGTIKNDTVFWKDFDTMVVSYKKEFQGKLKDDSIVNAKDGFNKQKNKTQINQLVDEIEVQNLITSNFIPDTSINSIHLLNSSNIQNYLGKNCMDEIIKNGETEDFPNFNVISENKEQKLSVYFHPGGVKYKFSEFKVSYNIDKSSKLKTTSDKEFVSESGVRLNLTFAELKAIKGEPKTITNDKENQLSTYQYLIDDFQHSAFLKRYNLPIYYAHYTFEKGVLIEFKFGFEYP
jgi:hypothetical protein